MISATAKRNDHRHLHVRIASSTADGHMFIQCTVVHYPHDNIGRWANRSYPTIYARFDMRVLQLCDVLPRTCECTLHTCGVERSGERRGRVAIAVNDDIRVWVNGANSIIINLMTKYTCSEE